MKRFVVFAASLLLLLTVALASTPTAAELLEKAKAEAKLQKKNILVKFDASW